MVRHVMAWQMIGNGWRFGLAFATPAVDGDTGVMASASAATISSNASSSCSMSRSIFSEDEPNRARLRTASCAFNLSIRVSRD
ncbi:Hypothetical protein NGAL_HAMBI2566_60540 [Neorhizobium galegae bv. orientalis]|nr:Hypothetical protein NGAL_HAMBI2566_60540 [Neorhizobium galegae bv. orientalis]CDZ73941.1 Hypothetical protein NGAL_HAMBI2610_55730 [Neorhizobium galegae bv. orientalis]